MKAGITVITMARKPLSEGSVAENVLKWETGGLNIDGAKIGITGGSAIPSGMDRLNVKLAEQGYRPNTYQKGVPKPPQPGGRWPPNLVLAHLSGCRVEGAKSETTPNWVCIPGCPVAELDQQSGLRTSGSKLLHHQRNVPRFGYGGLYGNDKGQTLAAVGRVWAGDAGGASRYFKQIKGKVPDNPPCPEKKP